MVDLRLFRSRGFAAGNLAKVVAYLAFGAHTFLLPFYMYRALGLTPETLGWTLTPLPIGMLVASLTFGPLSDRIGTRLLAAAGLLVVACSAVLLAGVQPEQGLTPAVVSMALAGLGIGAFIAPNDSAILAVTPRGKVGVANGIMGVSRSLGLALGQSVAAGLLAAGLAAGGEPALVPSFHRVYLVVALLGLLGAGLASVRDTPRPRPTPGA
jgi:MFS family permease